MNKTDRIWHVYLLQCADGTLYTGVSLDPQRRVQQHNAGRAARYTRRRLPVQLLGTLPAGSQREALLLESRIKRCAPARKRAFFAASGDPLPGKPCRRGRRSQ